MNVAYYLLPGAFVLLFLLERRFPLRTPKSRLVPRLIVNAVVSAVAVAVALVLVRPVAMRVLQLASEEGWGLANAVAMNPLLQAIVVVLLMDLSFYYWHRANHAWPFLWRFHNAHHVDPDLDVTTAMRFHVVEIAYSSAFRALQVIVIGGEAWMFVLYETCFQLNTFFQHSNVRLPIRVERILSLLLVTPRMHGIHHSKRFPETNSNWSTGFSFWDRLHRTLRLDVPQSTIDIGIAGYSRPDDNTVRAVFSLPFLTQRDYWNDAGAASATRENPSSDSRAR